MAYGNNRAAVQPRSHFQLAGGSIVKFRHPYLSGQIDTTGAVDEIDISACCKLDSRYFEALPNQDSAKQAVLIDGGVVTICNKLLNGTISMPVVRTTGHVATGDFIAALQLIKATGDSVGGLIYKTDFIDGQALTRLWLGVTVKNCPDDVSEGNDVAVYPVQLFYSAWIEATSSSMADNKKRIWAAGNLSGLEAYFAPYETQNTSGTTGTQDSMLSVANSGIPNSTLADSLVDNYNTADSPSEKAVLNGELKSGSTVIVKEPTILSL